MGSANHLRGDVHGHLRPWKLAGHGEPERDSRVDVGAADPGHGKHRHEHGRAPPKRDCDPARAFAFGAVEDDICDHTVAQKEKKGGSDEFGKEQRHDLINGAERHGRERIHTEGRISPPPVASVGGACTEGRRRYSLRVSTTIRSTRYVPGGDRPGAPVRLEGRRGRTGGETPEFLLRVGPVANLTCCPSCSLVKDRRHLVNSTRYR